MDPYPDPESLAMLDPDPDPPDPQHCFFFMHRAYWLANKKKERARTTLLSCGLTEWRSVQLQADRHSFHGVLCNYKQIDTVFMACCATTSR
jgi:hypothetical protein